MINVTERGNPVSNATEPCRETERRSRACLKWTTFRRRPFTARVRRSTGSNRRKLSCDSMACEKTHAMDFCVFTYLSHCRCFCDVHSFCLDDQSNGLECNESRPACQPSCCICTRKSTIAKCRKTTNQAIEIDPTVLLFAFEAAAEVAKLLRPFGLKQQ